MTLNFEVETLDGVPEDMRGLYTENDGKFRLAVDGLPKIEDTTALRSALQKERERAKAADKYEKLGKTPDEIAEMLALAEKAAEDDAKKRGDFDALRKQDADKYTKQIEEITTSLEAARKHERAAVVQGGLISALAKEGFTESGIDLLPGIVANRISIETEDGKRVTKIYQTDGETLMAGTGEGGVASFADLAKELAGKYPELVTSNILGGGGKQPSSSPKGGKFITRAEFDQLPLGERGPLLRSGITVKD